MVNLINPEYPEDKKTLQILVKKYQTPNYTSCKKKYAQILLVAMFFCFITLFFPSYKIENILLGVPLYAAIICGGIALIKYKNSGIEKYGQFVLVIISIILTFTANIAVIMIYSISAVTVINSITFSSYSFKTALILIYIMYIIQTIIVILSLKSHSNKFVQVILTSEKKTVNSKAALGGSLAGIAGYIASKYILGLGLLPFLSTIVILLSLLSCLKLVPRAIVFYTQYDRICEIRNKLSYNQPPTTSAFCLIK